MNLVKNVWNNDDMSGLEKVLTTVTTLAFVVPNLASGLQALETIFHKNTLAKIINTAATKAAAKAEKRKAKEGIYRDKVLEASKVNTKNI